MAEKAASAATTPEGMLDTRASWHTQFNFIMIDLLDAQVAPLCTSRYAFPTRLRTRHCVSQYGILLRQMGND